MNITEHRASIINEIVPRAGVLCRLNRKTTERVLELFLEDGEMVDDLQSPASEVTRDEDLRFYSRIIRQRYERSYGIDPITAMILAKVIAYAIEALIKWYLSSRDSRLTLSGYRAALSAHRLGFDR